MTEWPEALVERVARSIAHSRGVPDYRPIPLGYRADARAALDASGLREAQQEIERLNKWADGFSDAQLKERRLCEEHIREVTAGRDALREQLREAVEAASAFEDDLSEYCDGPKRDRLRTALARIKGVP